MVTYEGTPTTAVPPLGWAGAGVWTLAQTLPPPTANACGLPPISTFAVTLLLRSSIRTSVPSPPLATQTLSPSVAIAVGVLPTADRRDHRAGGRVDRLDGAVERVRDPDGALPDCNRGRSPPDRDLRDRSRGIDADDEVGLAVGKPRAPEPERGRRRSGVRVQLPERAPAARVDPRQEPRARRDQEGFSAPAERAGIAHHDDGQPARARDAAEGRVDPLQRQVGVGRPGANGPQRRAGNRKALRGYAERDRGGDPPRSGRDPRDRAGIGKGRPRPTRRRRRSLPAASRQAPSRQGARVRRRPPRSRRPEWARPCAGPFSRRQRQSSPPRR